MAGSRAETGKYKMKLISLDGGLKVDTVTVFTRWKSGNKQEDQSFLFSFFYFYFILRTSLAAYPYSVVPEEERALKIMVSLQKDLGASLKAFLIAQSGSIHAIK